MKKILVVLIVLIIAALGAKKLLATKKELAQQATPKPMHYSIDTVHVQTDGIVSAKRSFLAQVQNDKEVKITTKLSGRIKKVYVSESQHVKKGDILVSIDATSVQSNLNSLQDTLRAQLADVAYFQQVLARNTKLYKAKAIAKEKYDASIVQLKSKKAQAHATQEKIRALKSDMNYLRIRAPFDGIVSSILLHEGDLASFSKPILILNDGKQKMLFTYAQNEQTSIKIGDKVYQNEQEIGAIVKIYPDAKNNLQVAEVALQTPLAVANNSFVSIDVEVQKAQGCVVPSNTLVHEKDATYVMIFTHNQFHKMPVKVIIDGGEKILINKCPIEPIAQASESKLSILPFTKNISLTGNTNEK